MDPIQTLIKEFDLQVFPPELNLLDVNKTYGFQQVYDRLSELGAIECTMDLFKDMIEWEDGFTKIDDNYFMKVEGCGDIPSISSLKEEMVEEVDEDFVIQHKYIDGELVEVTHLNKEDRSLITRMTPTYNDKGQCVKILTTNPDWGYFREEVMTHNSEGLLLCREVTNQKGGEVELREEYKYNDKGEVLEELLTAPAGGPPPYKKEYTYNDKGEVLTRVGYFLDTPHEVYHLSI